MCKGDGKNARQLELLERVVGDGNERGSDYASSPILLAQPISDFRGTAIDVVLQHQRYPAYCFAINIDSKIRFGSFGRDVLDPLFGVRAGVGMGETVTHVDPDFSIVRV